MKAGNKARAGIKIEIALPKSAEFMHTERYCNKKTEERQDRIEERPSNEMVAGADKR